MYSNSQRKRTKSIAFLLAVIVLAFCLAGCKEVKEDSYDYVVFDASKTLTYQLNADKKTYSVVGIDGDYHTYVAIPPYYNGKKVTHIASGAFEGQTALKKVVIPETVIEIGARAFYGCTALKTIDIQEFPTDKKYAKVTKKWVKGDLFRENVSQEEVEFYTSYCPDDYFIYENGSLFYLKPIYTNYKASRFTGVSLSKIGDQAFYGCAQLLAICIPDTVTELGTEAFGSCSSLRSVELSKQLAEIKEAAFADCVQLSYIKNNSSLPIRLGTADYGEIAKNALVVRAADGSDTYSNETYTLTEGGFLFSKDGDQAVLYAFLSTHATEGSYLYSAAGLITDSDIVGIIGGGSATTVSISPIYSSFAVSDLTAYLPDTYNGDPYTLYHFEGATEVVIPSCFTEINDEAFADSETLSVRISGNLRRIGKNAFRNSSIRNIRADGNNIGVLYVIRGDSITIDNNNGVSFAIDNSVTITIPDSIQEIDEGAFSGCAQLKEIQLGSNVSFIGKNAFSDCPNLETVKTYYTDGWEKNGTTVSLSAYDAMGELLLADLSAEWRNTVSKLTYEKIAKDNFYTVTGMGDCTDTVVTVASNYLGVAVTEIENLDLKNITDLHLPNTIESIRLVCDNACTLQTIVYDGTMEQWSAIQKHIHYDYEIESDRINVTVQCTDGTVQQPFS